MQQGFHLVGIDVLQRLGHVPPATTGVQANQLLRHGCIGSQVRNPTSQRLEGGQQGVGATVKAAVVDFHVEFIDGEHVDAGSKLYGYKR